MPDLKTQIRSSMPSLLKFISTALLVILVGCSSNPQSANPKYEKINSQAQMKKYTPYVPSDMKQIKDIPQFNETEKLMAPGHLFSLNHPSDNKLRGQFRVQFDGYLRLPYGVKIDVVGKEFGELKKQVMDAYHKFFQRGAEDVTFNLLRKQYWVEVRGFIKKSGYYLVDRKESIDKVIDKAGGLAGSLKRDFFTVSIKQKDVSYSISLNQYYDHNAIGTSLTWTGGDTIFVNLMNDDLHSQSVPTISILGGVLTPGKTLYRENATLYYYLQKAGGIIPNLGYEECYVIRRIDNKISRINFDITDMNTVPSIHAGDIIMMSAEKKTVVDRMWERATQIGAMLTSIAIVIIAL
jgi:protein involved in polysaccharide export with SLBB domain